MIKMIFAHANKGAFGNDGRLPWNNTDDLEHFKAYTQGDILVMSRGTFESLSCKLPGRTHVVLSDRYTATKNGGEPDCVVPMNVSLQALCGFLDNTFEADISVIGGRRLLEEAMRVVDQASITEILADYGHDVAINAELIHDYLDHVFGEPEERWLNNNTVVWTYGL